MTDDKESVTLMELRHPDNERPAPSLFPSIEGSANLVPDLPVKVESDSGVNDVADGGDSGDG